MISKNLKYVFPSVLHLMVCLFVCLYFYLFVNLFICMFICLFIPASVYLFNYKKFKLDNGLRKLMILFSIFEIMILPLVFLNSVISYRLLLYFFPSSILILSNMQELFLLRKRALIFFNSIIFLSFSSLVVWLNYSNHAYCWVPYKNFLLSS